MGSASGRLIGIITTMIMARVLAKEDLAAYRQAFLAYETVTPLLALGVSQGMYYFLPAETQESTWSCSRWNRGPGVNRIFVRCLSGLWWQ